MEHRVISMESSTRKPFIVGRGTHIHLLLGMLELVMPGESL